MISRASYTPPTLAELRRMSIEQLDRVFSDAPLLDLPKRRFDGETLVRLQNRGALMKRHRILEGLGFEAMRWGIDFIADDWFFYTPLFAIGHFQPRPGPSRWRDTESIGLHCIARLPHVIKRELYDEVKPLSDSLVLGIGGVNREKTMGDHFYFALRARE